MTCDLLVLDVHSHTSCVDVLKPDLWVMPMCNRTAYENAERIMPSLSGPALWVWSRGNVWRDDVPAHLRAQVSMSTVFIPNSRAIAETAETCSPAWATRLGARSPGGARPPGPHRRPARPGRHARPGRAPAQGLAHRRPHARPWRPRARRLNRRSSS